MAPNKPNKPVHGPAEPLDPDSSNNSESGMVRETTATTEHLEPSNTVHDPDRDRDRNKATVEAATGSTAEDPEETDSEVEEKTIHKSRHERGVIPSVEVLNSNSRRASRVQDALIHTLRQRLDCAVMSNEIFRRYLRSNSWDLDLAEASLISDFAVAQVRDGFALERRNSDQVDADYVHGAGSTQESHRRSIDVLYRRLNVGRARDDRHVITALELGLLLNGSSWVIESAMAELSSRQLDPAAQLSAVTETRVLRTPTNTQLNRDRRLATFLELTGTAFVASATEVLRSHDYDLGLVVDSWMRSTINPSDADIGHPCPPNAQARLSSELGSRWPDERPISIALSNLSSDEVIEANREYMTGSAEARSGFLIRYDEQPARRSMPNPRKFHIESIRGGKYRLLKHAGITVPGTGTIGKNGREVGREHRDMDWESPADITELNKWFSQPRRRVDKGLRRKQPASYLPLEHDWIHQYFRQKYDDVLLEDPDYRKNGGRWPIPIDSKQLTEELNKQFAERKDIPGAPADEPRPLRKASGILVYAKRQPAWCAEFGLKHTPAHKERTADTSRQRRAEHSHPSFPPAGPSQDEAMLGEERSESTNMNTEQPSQQPETNLDEQEQMAELHEDDLDDDEIEELRQVQPFEAERILRRRAERDRQRAAHRAEAFGREDDGDEATVLIGPTGHSRKHSVNEESVVDKDTEGSKRQRR